MKSILSRFVVLIAMQLQACSQPNAANPALAMRYPETIGGPCENCEAIYESPLPFKELPSIDTLPDFYEAGPKLHISGTVYQPDGRTPARDVVLYVYHTDQRGLYPHTSKSKGFAKIHGDLRGWVKTGADGRYAFFTLVPASYPNSNNPKHLHPIIMEADKGFYWIDEFVFGDDPLLPAAEKNRTAPRGGDGVLHPVFKEGMLRAHRNIVLGLNVPGYPAAKTTALQSGLAIGDACPAFDPLHLSGADIGKTACPMCKYGFGQGILLWFNQNNIEKLDYLAVRLEKEMLLRGEKNFRVFLVYMNPAWQSNSSKAEAMLQEKIREWCRRQSLKNVAVVWVPSPVDAETCGVFQINPAAQNTVFVYKKRQVTAKWIDVAYDEAFMQQVLQHFPKKT